MYFLRTVISMILNFTWYIPTCIGRNFESLLSESHKHESDRFVYFVVGWFNDSSSYFFSQVETRNRCRPLWNLAGKWWKLWAVQLQITTRSSKGNVSCPSSTFAGMESHPGWLLWSAETGIFLFFDEAKLIEFLDCVGRWEKEGQINFEMWEIYLY